MKNSVLALGLLFLLTHCTTAQNKPNKMSQFDFEKAWKEEAEFEGKGLPESALKVVIEIKTHAKSENNAGQLTKALIHELKLTGVKEEDASIKNMIVLKKEADQASFPVKPLLHSMLAELYWR